MSFNTRINLLLAGFFLICFLVGARLFYWQILAADKLAAAAENQHWISFEMVLHHDWKVVLQSFQFIFFQSFFWFPEEVEKSVASFSGENV